jgi:hypothetical protein
MEFLKGIHFISFVTVSIDDPLFFIVSYIGGFFHSLSNNEAFIQDYEKSLCYSFFLLFLIIDYTKISSNYCIYDILIIVLVLIALAVENIIMQYFVQNNNEVSYAKLIMRTLLLIISFISYLISSNKTVKYVLSYYILLRLY